MLKRKIDKATYTELSDARKELYEEKDGSYVLRVEDDDNGELKRAKDREVQARKDAEKKARELQEKLDEISGVDAKKRGDIETLEKSWKEKLTQAETEATAKINKLKDSLQRTLVDKTAEGIATKLSTVPGLMSRAIRERLTVDFDADQPSLRILDQNGKPSALTLDDLEKEIVANKDYASILIGSKASGSGTPADKTQQGRGGANNLEANGQPKSYRELSPAEQVAYLKEKKANEG
jgi:hypothetical protein